MTSLLAGFVDTPVVGHDPGWLLSFRPEKSGKVDTSAEPFEIGAEEYEVEITAAMPSGLEGGGYTITVVGMTDADYARIAQAKLPAVNLYVYYRDLPGLLGAASSITSIADPLRRLAKRATDDRLVAVLRVESVARRRGARQYEVTIKARERVFDVCTTTPVAEAIDEPLDGALKKLLGDHVDYQLHPTTKPPSATSPPTAPADSNAPKNIAVKRGDSILKALLAIGKKLEEGSGAYGREMFLIQAGKLHVAVRPVPLSGRKVNELTPRTGLVEIEALDPIVIDSTVDPKDSSKRCQFKLVLHGRPDLRPGDVVTVVPPDDEAATSPPLGVLGVGIDAVVGPFAAILGSGTAMRLYLSGVEHRLGRSSGFVTTLVGVEVTADQEWDEREVPRSAPAAAATEAASPAAHAAQAVKEVVASAISRRAGTVVGEIRGVTTEGQGPPPSQTETVFRGLIAGDGAAGQTARLDIERPSHNPARGVPYATPFALGKCGLVLPRYPGARVVLSHVDGLIEEPVDIGSLWEAGKGPDSEFGDWWLILPVDPSTPQTVADDAGAVAAHSGNATNDLIDSKGNRIIEVGELTIRVGAESLKSAGSRPEKGDDVVTIEHADKGAKLAIDSDGTITIHAAKDLVLEATDGSIKLNAQNVDVKVSGAMDVHG